MSKVFFIVTLFYVFSLNANAQDHLIYGKIKDSLTSVPVPQAEIYNAQGELLCISDKEGSFKFYTSKSIVGIFVFTPEYTIYSRRIRIKDFSSLDIFLSPLSVNLSEVEINEKRNKLSLDQFIEFIAEDELVEVTPENIRLRKMELDQNKRASQKKKEKYANQ